MLWSTNSWSELIGTRRSIRATIIACLILAAHGLIGWLVLTSVGPLSVEERSDDRGALVLLPASPAALLPERLPAIAQVDRSIRLPLRDLQQPSPLVDAPARGAAADPAHPERPPVDWTEQMVLAGRAAAATEQAQKFKDFGFPGTGSPSSPASPAFDWDYARTHRVESLPEGGIVVHVNDNCFVVFMPFPFPTCLLGKKKANGDLFKHMRDPQKLGDWKPAK